MRYLLMFLTLLAGAILPIQAIVNTRLGRQTGGALMGSLLSFTVGLICLLLINMATNSSALIQLRPMQTSPWYIWIGGVIGAVFVGYITWVNQQQGVALTFALVISGQIIMSLIVDHYGLFQSAVRNVTATQLAGVVLIIAGVVLVKK